jgi:hypothetical protein
MPCYIARVSNIKKILLILFIFGIIGCSSANIDMYRDESPSFNPFQYFKGNTKAWGIVQDRSGRVVRRFTVDIKGDSSEHKLTLDETFDYSDGTIDHRVWEIVKNPDGTIVGEADDILGLAHGSFLGNAMRWEYEMNLPVLGKVYKVKFDDWLWKLDHDSLINRSYIKKFGVTVAEVTLFFRKVPLEY